MLANKQTTSAATQTLGIESRSAQWQTRWRFLVTLLTLAVMYLALFHVEEWVTRRLAYAGVGYDDSEDAQLAAEVAEKSKVREAELPAQDPRMVFGFGVLYGYLSGRRSLPAEEMTRQFDPQIKQMQATAQFLGVGAVEPLPAHTEDDFIHFTERLEKDVGSVAARVEHATSIRLRHLFMLGVHAGTTMAGLELRGDPYPPPILLIGKHGTLSGMPKSLWHPLAQVPNLDRSTRLTDYATALQAVDGYLASDRSSPGQR